MMHRIVSSEREQLILVDVNDREIGSLDKAACHDDAGVLHRAFSLFIFDARGELLLQQRSAAKRLWPLYWSNSCCSHPRLGETMDEATARRLDDELHIAAELEFVYKFAYEARFDAGGSENELCWVYLGRTRDTIMANQNEIAATRTLSAAALDEELSRDPDQFTPWFRMEWQHLRGKHMDTLRRYLAPAP
ncbi:MAG TPA: isopentenyl-diphosphate Delta-isomerase [Woeseiaceae bacterium]|nr:isopentenyl-diphosphate Delta-isomerase [Woeseiaceae bacterium]